MKNGITASILMYFNVHVYFKISRCKLILNNVVTRHILTVLQPSYVKIHNLKTNEDRIKQMNPDSSRSTLGFNNKKKLHGNK